ncbi:hypothetical protein LSTR_LSTR005462 [Laodelphax striatellus]|uniref:Exostosin-2 n=1 Tax=Laodelphax striatellus TaxID=195883 RepID=A0A482WXD6_LAOST|nr:hypothetical protein LSTR_LSTR005462 [Laodelphax striatellus]
MVAKQYNILLNRYRRFFITVLAVLLISFLVICVGLLNLLPSFGFLNSGSIIYHKINLNNFSGVPRVPVVESQLPAPRNDRCNYFDCFNVYKCGHKGSGKILVFVYPVKEYVDHKGNAVAPMSKEFFGILQAVVKSRYYTPNPEEACLFVPSIDTLNQNRFNVKKTSQALSMLPMWHNGENHLIWNMLPGSPPTFSNVVELNIGNAVIAGAGFDSWTYRAGFDVSLPVYSPYADQLKFDPYQEREWLLLSSQVNIHPDFESELAQIESDNSDLFMLLEPCEGRENASLRCHQQKIYNYPQILGSGKFCLVIRGARLAQPNLMDALAFGCVPIVAADTMILPFADVIDWNRAVLTLRESDLNNVMTLVKDVSEERTKQMSAHCQWLYNKYFSSIESITITTLDIINDRIFPQNARSYSPGNSPLKPYTPQSPLYLQLTAPKAPGFTAVVLTYDRVESLFLLVQKLVKVPSLNKVLVVWNNQHKSPPPSSSWPKVSKPIKVIQTKENKLSNRFYPYEEIETEAVLHIDDDIVMLTADELEFGYEVWREFPDRIVGFPSRTHVWDNSTQKWKYESEWTNHISMVLTGAAFHHKYWNYMYTTSMPGDIKEWVDNHMNCEDIAMNFLVSNITNKAPIKVAPRKKFKCPECVNNEMLSADLSHMMERSRCIDRFSAVYGLMPLRTVEFRADPVLYKDAFPQKLKINNNIGSL